MSVGRPTVVIMADVAVPAPGIRSVPLTDLDFTVVDVETTGWAPEEADILQDPAWRDGMWGAYEVSRIFSDVGWRPRPPREAFHDYIDWLKENGL